MAVGPELQRVPRRTAGAALARATLTCIALVAIARDGRADPDPWASARPAGDVPSPELSPRGKPRDPAEAIEQARRQVLDDSFQADLPGELGGRGPDEGGAGSAGSARSERGDRPEDRGDRVFDVRDREQGGAGSSVMTVVMWGLVIAIAILLVAWLVSELWKSSADIALAPVAGSAALAAAAAAIIERPLGDADQLAERGEFAGAIHTLLLRTLQALVKTWAVQLAPAMTSREVLARVPLASDARSALADLITAVELTHFGGDPASAADYARCRDQFQRFAEALRARPSRAEAVAA